MNDLDWLEADEWNACRLHMDHETYDEFLLFVKAEEPFSVGIPKLILAIADVCMKGNKPSMGHLMDYRSVSHSCGESEPDKHLYRFLAFAIYGYNNWSNNDRRQKGLSPLKLRKKRGGKR